MLWDGQVGLSSGIGYNDNVLLSASTPRGSAFVVNGVDLMAMRVPVDGWQVVASAVGDDTRYWRDVGASAEDLFIASLQLKRELPSGWLLGLEGRGLYENQVLDVTTSVGRPATALVQGYGVTALPSLRKDLVAGLWLKLEFPLTRWLFKTPLDDYWEFGPVATAGYDFSKRSDLSLSYGVSYQPHDSWLAVSAYDIPLSNRLLIEQQQAGLAWHQYWDEPRRWRSTTRLQFACRQDNGGGYFNYYQYQAIQDLRWQTADWLLKGSAQLVYEDYPVQNSGGLGYDKLYRTLWSLSFEAERRLYKGIKSYAKVERRQAISNEAGNLGDYRNTIVTGGLRWEF